jgi:hypothetical protein
MRGFDEVATPPQAGDVARFRTRRSAIFSRGGLNTVTTYAAYLAVRPLGMSRVQHDLYRRSPDLRSLAQLRSKIRCILVLSAKRA